MLTDADADLVDRERAVPGLATILDGDRLHQWVADRAGSAATGDVRADVTYLRYKPATSVVAAVSVDLGQGPVSMYVKAFSDDARPKLAKARARADLGGDPPAAMVDQELGMILAPATADRHLPGVSSLLSSREPVVPLRYKPERRFVARVGEGEHRRLVKAHRRGVARRMAAHHRAVARIGVPAPALVSIDAARGLVTSAWVQGTPLSSGAGGTGSGADAADLAEVGALLARLHAGERRRLSQAPPLPVTLTDAVDALASIAPALRPVADAVAAEIIDQLGGRPSTLGPVHGDCSADQVLRTDDGLLMLDFDRVRCDDPAVDLASWAAAAVAGSNEHLTDPMELLRPLLDGHQAAGGPPVADRLVARTAIALLERAVEPFRYRTPDWAEQALAVVRLAHQLVDR